MARNRKRAKERRARRPQASTVRRGLASAPENGVPDPIEHAMPDVELANAQLAMGRPEAATDSEGVADSEAMAESDPVVADSDTGYDPGLDAEADYDPAVDAEEAYEEELESDGGDGRPSAGGGALAVRGRGGAAVAEPRSVPGNRLVGFLQGSWRELQRVQWPDRRQVIQATSVVIGFVIIAGAFLGLADLVASKLMSFVLK